MNGGKAIASRVEGVAAAGRVSGVAAAALMYGVVAAAGVCGVTAPRVAPAAEAAAPSNAGVQSESRGTQAAARVQRSAEGYVRDREPNTLHDIFTLEETHSVKREALRSAKPADDSATNAIGATSGLRSIQYGDHWVFDAGTDLLLDADRDGYYRYLRVHFDVDSVFDRAYVYARLYTSPDGESWDFYYETDDFLVTGKTPDDAYEVESELLANYPPNLYDVLVEIYDADKDVLVDEFGPVESSALSLLPLEDADFDMVTPPPVVITEEHGGGGSFSWASLLALTLALAGRRVTVPASRKKMPGFEPGDFGGPSDELAR